MERHQLSAGGDPDAWILGIYIREARAGRTEALGSALRTCEQSLRLMAEDRVPDQIKAKVAPSDLVQDTFLAAHGNFAAFRGTTGQELIAWIKKIMQNRIAEIVRSYTSHKRAVHREIQIDRVGAAAVPPEALVSRSMTPESWLILCEEIEALDRALEKLSPRERAVLDLIHRDELDYGRAGAVLGLSYDQTRREWYRILKRLRDSIQGTAAHRGE